MFSRKSSFRGCADRYTSISWSMWCKNSNKLALWDRGFRPGFDRACYGFLCICTWEGYRSVAPLGASTNVNRTIRITRLQVGIFGRCFMKHTRYQVSYTIIGITITGVHSNQDQIWLVRMGEYIGFYVDRRSWLLWSPVNRWFLGSTGRCYDDG